MGWRQGGETRLPRAPSALPSCRDARRDRGRSGEAAAPRFPQKAAVLSGFQCPSTRGPAAPRRPCQLVPARAPCPRPRGAELSTRSP